MGNVRLPRLFGTVPNMLDPSPCHPDPGPSFREAVDDLAAAVRALDACVGRLTSVVSGPRSGMALAPVPALPVTPVGPVRPLSAGNRQDREQILSNLEETCNTARTLIDSAMALRATAVEYAITAQHRRHAWRDGRAPKEPEPDAGRRTAG